MTQQSLPTPDAKTVVLATSNGAGLGHVTRLMAAARRLPRDVVPVIATQSLGAPIVEREGYLVEYIKSFSVAGLSRSEWNDYLELQFNRLIEIYDPAAIIYDGVVPYRGMVSAWEGRGITTGWLRRALWRAGSGYEHIAKSSSFDVVIEPADVAADADLGASVSDRNRTIDTHPITYLSREELRARDDTTLMPAGDRPRVLVQLGAGNINDTRSLTNAVIDAAREHDFEPVLAISPIAQEPPKAAGVKIVREYPLSAHLPVFDLAVGAAGYNSVHEYIMAGTPSILVPNVNTGLDDQYLRAHFMHSVGAAALGDSLGAITASLEAFADPAARVRAQRALSRLRRPNGASRLAEIISQLAGSEETLS